MTDEELIVRYVESGVIGKKEVSQLRRSGAATRIEKIAISREVSGGDKKKLFRLLNLLQSQESYKDKRGAGMYGAINRSGEKSFNPYMSVSGGGVNGTGKKR